MAYTNIDDPSAHFQIALYTGNGSTQNITNDGNSDLQPDLVWTKARSDTSHHTNVDSSRGAGKQIYPNLTAAEETVSGVSGFLTDGFSLGSNGTANANTITHVAWQWKANGGTTASNTDGSITSTVQANTDAGFSIVTYTGTGSAATIGHGLGVKPDIIIFKRRNGTNNWDFQYKGELRLTLNLTDAEATNVLCTFTSTTTDLGSTATAEKNANTGTYVAYCFAEKQGYSKFGKYVGNGAADGPFVYTGFKPAFVLVKSSSATHNWHILDNKRDPSNVVDKYLNPDNTAAEDTFTFGDFVSNGFKWRSSSGTSFNESGTSYIYMAFAENPFTTSTGVPATAR
jgi:hypothetical protein